MPKSTTIIISLAIVALCGGALVVVRPLRGCTPSTDPVLVPLGAVPPEGWRGKVEASGAVVAPTREVRR